MLILVYHELHGPYWKCAATHRVLPGLPGLARRLAHLEETGRAALQPPRLRPAHGAEEPERWRRPRRRAAQPHRRPRAPRQGDRPRCRRPALPRAPRGVDRARSADERAEAWERIAQHRRFRAARKIEGRHALRLGLGVPGHPGAAQRAGFQHDPAWVARTLVPPVTEARARTALSTLSTWGCSRRPRRAGWSRGRR